MANDKFKASSQKRNHNSGTNRGSLGAILNSKITLKFSAALKSLLLWGTLALLFAVLIMISAQETFKDILLPLGLYNDRTGALVDCSKPGNSRSRYCGGDSSGTRQKLSEDPRSGAGFNLFD